MVIDFFRTEAVILATCSIRSNKSAFNASRSSEAAAVLIATEVHDVTANIGHRPRAGGRFVVAEFLQHGIGRAGCRGTTGVGTVATSTATAATAAVTTSVHAAAIVGPTAVTRSTESLIVLVVTTWGSTTTTTVCICTGARGILVWVVVAPRTGGGQ